MIIDSLTRQLFGTFPREVGIKRGTANTPEDFEKFLLKADGVEECFTSVYPSSGTIDKIFFDFDGGSKALEDAKKVYGWLTSHGFTVAVIASGKKGIHLHCLLNPVTTSKELLTRSTQGILEAVGGCSTADVHCIGDIRRLCRVPNTRRPPENKFWCTHLPPQFMNWTWHDVVNWTLSPHELSCLPFTTKSIMDLPQSDVIVRQEYIPTAYTAPSSTQGQGNVIKEITMLHLELKPCILKAVLNPHPRECERVASIAQLHWKFTTDEIVNLYSKLGWTDWDEGRTREKIADCSHLHRYSCSKLRQYNICTETNYRECYDYDGT